jgi:hypothetical protein
MYLVGDIKTIKERGGERLENSKIDEKSLYCR